MTTNLHFAAPAAMLTRRLRAVLPSLFYPCSNWLRFGLISRKQARLCLIILSGLLACIAYPEQLPSRPFTTQDGLPLNRINDILADSHGLLWFASDVGLTRFDGYDFRTFTEEDGLPSPVINALIESRDGTFWLAAGRKLCHFQPHSSTGSNPAPKEFAAYDLAGTNEPTVLLEDHRGRIWMGTWNGLHLLRSKPEADHIIEHSWTEQDGLSSRIIQSLFQSHDGKLWALTEHGLTGWDQTSATPQFHKYEDTGGWLVHGLYGMAEDPQGALWVITESSGVVRLSRNGLTRFQKSDGLLSLLVRDVIEDRAHNIWIGTMGGGVSIRDRKTGQISSVMHGNAPSERVGDSHGNMWMGWWFSPGWCVTKTDKLPNTTRKMA